MKLGCVVLLREVHLHTWKGVYRDGAYMLTYRIVVLLYSGSIPLSLGKLHAQLCTTPVHGTFSDIYSKGYAHSPVLKCTFPRNTRLALTTTLQKHNKNSEAYVSLYRQILVANCKSRNVPIPPTCALSERCATL